MKKYYENDPGFVFVKEWETLLELLQSTYTTNTRDICKRLQCSRSWVNKYIRPHVKHVFVSNGYSCRSVPVTARLKSKGVIETSDSTWYDEAGFVRFILSNSQFHQRSKKVYHENYVEDMVGWKERCDKYMADRVEIMSNGANPDKVLSRLRMLEERVIGDLENYLSPQGKFLFDDIRPAFHRGESRWVEVACPDKTVSTWRTAADMKDYGDVDEALYRHLFNEGYVRCTVTLPDINGELGRKVFHVKDPHPHVPDEEKCLLGIDLPVDYELWLRHK